MYHVVFNVKEWLGKCTERGRQTFLQLHANYMQIQSRVSLGVQYNICLALPSGRAIGTLPINHTQGLCLGHRNRRRDICGLGWLVTRTIIHRYGLYSKNGVMGESCLCMSIGCYKRQTQRYDVDAWGVASSGTKTSIKSNFIGHIHKWLADVIASVAKCLYRNGYGTFSGNDFEQSIFCNYPWSEKMTLSGASTHLYHVSQSRFNVI